MSKIKLAITQLRKLKNVTQSQLAEHLGVSFQAVSKWENEITMPDISLLPSIAEYFNVTVDQLLGVQPLNYSEYISRETNKAEHWNNKLNYLKQTRALMWNDDYFKFLVKQVWSLNRPIKVIDFGCGYGFLAEKLMPILPIGSTYTGIDISEKLINEGKKIFSNKPYKTQFVYCSFNDFKAEAKYDLAICQAVLRHLPNPKQVLAKMISSVVKGGRVVTIEVNRKLEEVGLYLHEQNYQDNSYFNVMQKNWSYELYNNYRDYSVGFKIPFYMNELGLNNVDIRVNDKVALFNQSNDDLLNTFIESYNWYKDTTKEQKNKTITHMMSRGLNRAEAEKYISYHQNKVNYFKNNNIQIARAMCLLISTGLK